MSGGSYNYAFGRVQDMADTLADSKIPLRRAFAKHLSDVAKAMHDIEWVDSDDYGPGDENAAIRKVLGENAPALELSAVVEDATRILAELTEAIAKAKP